jgi:ABC-type multidrug transport system fused ATPase/permease subunit
MRRIEQALEVAETTKYEHNQANRPESIGFDGVVASWSGSDDSTFALRNLDLDFKVGLHIVTGAVGDGKSSLLLALLHEMLVSQGIIYAPAIATRRIQQSARRTAFCAQSAFLVSGTIRANILFGSDYLEDRYQAVIKACALEPDLAILQYGDLTEVGHNGQRTSGGQRQRICLARAVYSDASILLLDDVLSAVDSGSAKSICNSLFGGPLLKSRTVILVSYYVPVLKVRLPSVCLLS